VSRYLITTHPHLPGVGLSKPGSWGNLRFADDAAASEAARSDAGSGPIAIERATVRRKLSLFSKD